MKDEKSRGTFGKSTIIITAIISVIVGALIMFLLNEFVFQTVITTKGHNFNKGELFDSLKVRYGLTAALQETDNAILKDKYKLTDEMKSEIEEEARGYIDNYIDLGYTQEEFLSNYGFESYDTFIEDLSNAYRQKLYYADYLTNILGEDKIKEYYDSDNVYGDINCKHILVKITDEVTDSQSKELITTILGELNNGNSWEDTIEKYKDQIVSEDLGYVKFDSALEGSFKEALRSMETNSYSKEPVQTSYGYHIIYKLDQKDKPSYDYAKVGIATILGSDLEAEDNYLQYKAISQLESENNIKIKDKLLKKQYDEYLKTLNVQ